MKATHKQSSTFNRRLQLLSDVRRSQELGIKTFCDMTQYDLVDGNKIFGGNFSLFFSVEEKRKLPLNFGF
jgi:hypothetical protein